jgi:hypothetical protein
MRLSMAERLTRRLEPIPESGCLVWIGAVDRDDYGEIWTGASRASGVYIFEKVHRVAWQLAYGPIPAGLSVLHRCDVRRCAAPTHLFLGTHADNCRDRHRKGRTARGAAAGSATLTIEEVAEIRALYCRGRHGRGAPALARRFGVGRTAIRDIVTGHTWR